MTEAEYSAQIQEEQSAITRCQNEIDNIWNQIQSLRNLLAKLEMLYEQLGRSSTNALDKILNACHLFGRVRTTINSDFFSSYKEAVGGTSYVSAQKGVLNAQEEVQSKLEQLQAEIERKQEAIYSSRNNISNLQYEIQMIEIEAES